MTESMTTCALKSLHQCVVGVTEGTRSHRHVWEAPKFHCDKREQHMPAQRITFWLGRLQRFVQVRFDVFGLRAREQREGERRRLLAAYLFVYEPDLRKKEDVSFEVSELPQRPEREKERERTNF